MKVRAWLSPLLGLVVGAAAPALLVLGGSIADPPYAEAPSYAALILFAYRCAVFVASVALIVFSLDVLQRNARQEGAGPPP